MQLRSNTVVVLLCFLTGSLQTVQEDFSRFSAYCTKVVFHRGQRYWQILTETRIVETGNTHSVRNFYPPFRQYVVQNQCQ